MKINTYKKFTILFVILIGLFVTFNFVTWHLFLKQVLTRDEGVITGDLSRMGYITDLVQPRINSFTQPYRHIKATEYNWEKLDLITIGDSFSAGTAGGINRYYQDFIATKMQWLVLNLPPSYPKRNFLDLVRTYHAAGIFKQTGIKYLMIQSTQRNMFKRFAVKTYKPKNTTLTNLIDHYKFKPIKKSVNTSTTIEAYTNPLGENKNLDPSQILPELSFINNGNLKFWWNKLMYQFDDCAFVSDSCRIGLNKSLFSIKNGKEGLFYKGNITSQKKSTEYNINLMNNNLNQLADELAKDNIKLIVMPVVSKYALYQPYFTNSKYQPDPFFDMLRAKKKDYIFIDTDSIFKQALANGEKDIFFIDDTHWTARASDLVTDNLKKQINSHNRKN